MRGLAGHVGMAMGAVATVGALGAAATLAAVWFLGSAVVTNPYVHATAPSGPGRLALAGYDPATTGAAQTNFETAWARTQPSRLAGGMPLIVEVPESPPKPVIAAAPAPVRVAKLDPPKAAPIPLPPARPVMAHQELAHQDLPHQELARAPVEPPAVKAPTQVAVALPLPAAIPEKRIAPQVAPIKEPAKELALSDADSRTAVYDIAAGTVYLPNGQKLEAHSGLYDKMDDPRFVHVRMRGPTPPNIYDLTMRQELFHGVRAIRLNPVDSKKMFGRDGMLAHTYMLGPNGQSNGCVSFKNYDKFLQAFLKGEVDRLVVVGQLGNMSWREAARTGRGPVKRYASYTPTVTAYAREERGAGTW
ncbi:MAG: DUF2778 domain-containing protein [Pseudolabrys sp.]|nr:DUF2778 domain-containing protein [Pseudolabrys sp.]